MSRLRLAAAGGRAGAAFLALIAIGLAPAQAGDVKAGGAVAAAKCEMCHGLDGVSKIPEAPNLAGQNEQYLAEQLKAFKGGSRQNDMMSLIVQQISDTDIDNLAAYYAAIQVTVGKVPAQ